MAILYRAHKVKTKKQIEAKPTRMSGLLLISGSSRPSSRPYNFFVRQYSIRRKMLIPSSFKAEKSLSS